MLSFKKFTFLRHGQTDWNDKRLCQGQKDIPLNQKGREEALILARVIPKFSKMYSSPLIRALETAEIIGKGAYIHKLDELKERDWGSLEGISSQEMYRIEEQEEQDPSFIPHASIETRQSFKERILKGMNRALRDENPLIVSHGRVFLVLCEIMGHPLIRQIPNTQLIECEPSKNGWKITVL